MCIFIISYAFWKKFLWKCDFSGVNLEMFVTFNFFPQNKVTKQEKKIGQSVIIECIEYKSWKTDGV